MTSVGASISGKKRPKAATPWCSSISRPSWTATPDSRRVRTQRVSPAAYTRSSAARSRRALEGSSGSGSASLSPRGVALMATSGVSAPRAACAFAPRLVAHSANAWARAASRDNTCSSARACAAATATARAAPPVPISSHRPAPFAPSCLSEASTPATSVLSPTSVPCSVQNVLHAPTRAHRSVLRARHRSAASLSGTVTFPAAPTIAQADRTPGSAPTGQRSATYTASSPRARNAALYIGGERECSTGSPSTANRRVLALISTAGFRDDAIHRGGDEGGELGRGVAIHLEVAPEGVADLGGVAAAARVLAQHEHAAFAPQLVHPGAVVARHRKDEIGLLHDVAREQPGAMAGEIESLLEADEVGTLRHRGAVPRTRAGGGHVDPIDAALAEGALHQRRRQRAA